jgi:FlaA1/EpsC-like NDP-sugar epimerase
LILAFHAVTIALSLVTAFLLRFDSSIPADTQPFVYWGIALALIVKMPIFVASRLDRGWWRFVGIPDLWRVLVANGIASAVFIAIALPWLSPAGFPRAVFLIDFLICFLTTGAARFAVRIYNEALSRANLSQGAKVILIYGAGAAGRMLQREINSNPRLGYDVVGFIDDDRRLQGSMVLNVPVLGAGRDIPHVIDRYKRLSRCIDEVIIAMPSALARQTREAIANCRSAGVGCKTIPRFDELLAGKVLTSQIRNINLVDLLGREPVGLDEDRIHESIAGRTILITGAAGSIGSELCRQAARFGPAKMVLLDQAESPLYSIDLELRSQFPLLDVVAELADIRDRLAVDELIRRHRVNAIFHAAAYKHVPMMEAHIIEAVKTNVVGTWNLVRAAYRNSVENFLMISTDKAVNPSSIMGLTKRVAELIVYARSSNGAESGTRFASVRFGNVLGSSGSVVPLFQAQIAAGGPVTVTHPDMRRYFMSVKEAVQLVLQASTMCKDSDIFVLDMGEPVRIMDLATNMIALAGLVPGEDVEIRISGLRPGEKLFEELRIEGENISATYHEKIKIFRGIQLTRRQLETWLSSLTSFVEARDSAAILDQLRAVVPEYQPHVSHRTEAAVAAFAPVAGDGSSIAGATQRQSQHIHRPPAVQTSF